MSRSMFWRVSFRCGREAVYFPFARTCVRPLTPHADGDSPGCSVALLVLIVLSLLFFPSRVIHVP